MLEDYKLCHVSTSTNIDNRHRQNRMISVVTVDIFRTYQDPDTFITYKVEHLNPKHLSSEFDFHLN